MKNGTGLFRCVQVCVCVVCECTRGAVLVAPRVFYLQCARCGRRWQDTDDRHDADDDGDDGSYTIRAICAVRVVNEYACMAIGDVCCVAM